MEVREQGLELDLDCPGEYEVDCLAVREQRRERGRGRRRFRVITSAAGEREEGEKREDASRRYDLSTPKAMLTVVR
jgi:hypothetical protein